MKLKLIFIICLFVQCQSSKVTKTPGNYTYKTECMGIEHDGSLTLKTWGTGKNETDAMEQAKKNAVRDVIFQSVLEGKQDCVKAPLVPEANAEEKYEEYFNKFFSDGGKYRKYVALEGKKHRGTIITSRENVTKSLIVRVFRPELKEKLISDGIIKQ